MWFRSGMVVQITGKKVCFTHRHPLMSKFRICSPPTIPSCELHLNVKSVLTFIIRQLLQSRSCHKSISFFHHEKNPSPMAVLNPDIIDIAAGFLSELYTRVLLPFSHRCFHYVQFFCGFN